MKHIAQVKPMRNKARNTHRVNVCADRAILQTLENNAHRFIDSTYIAQEATEIHTRRVLRSYVYEWIRKRKRKGWTFANDGGRIRLTGKGDT